MIRKVDMFMAPDGTLHESEELAEVYVADEISASIDQMFGEDLINMVINTPASVKYKVINLLFRDLDNAKRIYKELKYQFEG